MEQDTVKEEVRRVAEDGWISCHNARALAEELNVNYAAVGRACNELNIKIYSCELGCF